MPMSVVYTTINGELMYENRGGVYTEYKPDTLGSCIRTCNSAGTPGIWLWDRLNDLRWPRVEDWAKILRPQGLPLRI